MNETCGELFKYDLLIALLYIFEDKRLNAVQHPVRTCARVVCKHQWTPSWTHHYGLLCHINRRAIVLKDVGLLKICHLVCCMVQAIEYLRN